MPELDDERYVRELFEQLYKIQLRKVPESRAKTFDFELMSRQRRIAAVEVKRFEWIAGTVDRSQISVRLGPELQSARRTSARVTTT